MPSSMVNIYQAPLLILLSSVSVTAQDWINYDCSISCQQPTSGFLAGLENRDLEFVCVALGPVPFNAEIDRAIPGKYERGFRGCNVVGSTLGGIDNFEVSHPKFAILRNSSSFIWGPPVWPGQTPVTHPLGMTKGGTPVTICRTYRTSTAVHSGYVSNNVCLYSFGGSSAASSPGAFDVLWNVSSLPPSSMVPVTPLPSTLPTPSPSLSSTRSVTSSQTPSPSSTPAVAGANEVWIDRAVALSLGYDKSAFVQSGTDNYGLDPIFVCRGELQNGFTGPMIISSTSPSSSGPLPLAFRSNFDSAINLTDFTPAPSTAGFIRVSLDEANRRAFVLQRNSNTVAVVDLTSGLIIFRIQSPFLPTDVLAVPSSNLVLISSSIGNAVFGYSSLPPYGLLWISTALPSASSLDADASANAAFVSTTGAVVRLDLTNPTITPPQSTIMLLASVRATSVRNSATSKLFYVAIPSGSASASIDIYRKTSLSKTSSWPMSDYGASDVLAFALDAKNPVLIAVAKAASSSDQVLIVVNLLDGELIHRHVLSGATQECSHLVFDSASGSIVITCGAASVFAFQQLSISSYRLLQSVTLPAGSTGSVAAAYSSSLQILYIVTQAASGQTAKVFSYTITSLSAMPAPVSPFGLPAVVPGRFDLLAFFGSSSVCVVPFNITDTSLFGPTIAYKLLLRSPSLVWGTSLSPAQRASSRPVLAGAVGGRNATVCRAWSNDCEKNPSRWCTPTGPHSGYVFLDDAVPVCTYAYPKATVMSTSFDVLFNVAVAPLVSQTALPLPAASTSPSRTPSPSISMSAPVPGVLQWISKGTTDSVFVGYDGSMLTDVVTVCRGLVNGEFVPGKRVNSNPFCDVPIHGVEVLDVEFESLRNNQRLFWAPYSSSSTTSGTMVEMSYNFERAVVCRARYNNDGSTHSGFTNLIPYYNNQQPTCVFSWGGSVKNNYTFDVLYALPKPSETPTPSVTPSSTLTPVTVTPTPTKTPTVSPTGTPSNSRTPSSTTTPTRTPTKTPTPTSTSSSSPSIGASTSPTRSVTKSVTSTPSASQQPIVIDPGFKLSNSDGSASAVTQSVLAVAGIFSCLVAYAVYMGIGTRGRASTSSSSSSSNSARTVVTDRTPLPIAWENDPSLSYAYIVPSSPNNNSNNNQASQR
jgi:hypothetical protein